MSSAEPRQLVGGANAAPALSRDRPIRDAAAEVSARDALHVELGRGFSHDVVVLGDEQSCGEEHEHVADEDESP